MIVLVIVLGVGYVLLGLLLRTRVDAGALRPEVLWLLPLFGLVLAGTAFVAGVPLAGVLLILSALLSAGSAYVRGRVRT